MAPRAEVKLQGNAVDFLGMFEAKASQYCH